ncbi:MAG: universal stress protein [Stenomitos frigidus ULC029]
MFQRLIICTDFSDGLHRLANFVSSFAEGGVKQLVFLHSVPLVERNSVPRTDEAGIEQARERLGIALDQIPSGVDVQVEVGSGSPVDLILKVASRYTADLILTGTPTRSLLEEKFFGSTTAELVQRLTVPLMVMRPQLIATYTSEELSLRCRHLCRYLLVPYHGSPASKSLVQKLKQSSQSSIALQLHLCWVVNGIGRRDIPIDYQLDSARQELNKIAAELGTSNVIIDPVEVRDGDPLTEVLAAAQEANVSAIVTTSSVPNKLLSWSAPQFTDELLRRSWHPIIYFPSQR